MCVYLVSFQNYQIENYIFRSISDKSAQVDYEIRRICGTKEELPDISWEEFDRKSKDPNFVGQMRVPPKPLAEVMPRAPKVCQEILSFRII